MCLKSLMVTMIAVLVSSAFAAQPLITKTNGTGNVPMEYYRSEICEVYFDKVIIKKTSGYESNGIGFNFIGERNIKLSSGILSVIKRATKEKIEETDNYICDLPATFISSNHGKKKFTLFSSGGCGSPQKERVGPASRMLVELVDTYCEKTHRVKNL